MSDRLKLFEEVNFRVNASIHYVSDEEQYGIPDYWTIPKQGLGDCDDYTLAKRDQLLAAGVPLADLRIAFCKVPGQGFHAVLVATDPATGDWVLDNRHAQILSWSATGYHLISIQEGQGWQTATIERGGNAAA